MIDDQIRDTEELIKREEEGFRARKGGRGKRHGPEEMTASPPPPGTATDTKYRDGETVEPPIHDTHDGSGGDIEAVAEERVLERQDHDDSHEVVLETNEDTVIY